ncbi:MAG TPA: cell division protein ZapA [Bacillota bacterium]|nr:cell division protein ZapA [Bacillota bacterium]HOY89089.1 cell division protein ZapA [Bacillota bacterium]HPI02080.1 cell division protein ZapA [Bacillota bacterium]HPM63210.1 cell division protein ZapA [Bacillota bacterium]HQJ24206.1 cell division protein ZapA [Bacillota bacterium]
MDTADKAHDKRRVTVPVKIMGESFLITGEQDEGHVISLAKELDGKLMEARKLMPTASPHRIAISVALELISLIRKEREKSDSLLETIERT